MSPLWQEYYDPFIKFNETGSVPYYGMMFIRGDKYEIADYQSYSVEVYNKEEGKIELESSIENVKFGCTSKYGKFYTHFDDNVTLKDISNTDSLYIGSVWKDSGKTHFSVTNDTDFERTLTIVTDNGLNMFQQPTVFIISLFSQITK